MDSSNTQDLRTIMAQLRRMIEISMSTIDDDELLQEVSLTAPAYRNNYPYKMNEIFSWGTNGVGDPQLYKVIQSHTSAPQWRPDLSPSLYKAIGLTEDGYPIWAQPTGAHDAYNIGDKVSYNGIIYESLINGNSTVPGTDDRWWHPIGTGEESEPEPEEEIPDWVQPTGGHNAYNIGDKVRYASEVWESLINSNTTVPGSDDRWWKKVI